MDFLKFFALIKPPITWFDDDAFWVCKGCNVKMDKSSKEIHWPINCSLSKLRTLQKIRDLVIEANPELYQKYYAAKGIKINVKSKVKDKSVPLSWYKKQIENFAKLPMNIEEPSGAETDDSLYPPIPHRKLTEEDLVPKICAKHIIKTSDPIIDSIPMKDEPFRDIEGNVISLEELEELKESEEKV